MAATEQPEKRRRGRPKKSEVLRNRYLKELAVKQANREKNLRGKVRSGKKSWAKRITGGLRKADEGFFAKIGSAGGKVTKKILLELDPDYYTRLAIISHQVRRENQAAREEAEAAQAKARARAKR